MFFALIAICQEDRKNKMLQCHFSEKGLGATLYLRTLVLSQFSTNIFLEIKDYLSFIIVFFPKVGYLALTISLYYVEAE